MGTAGAGRRAGAEEIAGGAEHGWPPETWTDLPRPWRRAVVLGLVLAVSAAVVPPTVAAARSWWVERDLRDQLAVSAELGVSSSSSSPAGGRVDYYAVLRNDGPRAASFEEVTIAEARLRVRGSSRLAAAPVRAGGELFVPLSVDLDCSRPEAIRRADTVRGAVRAVAASGRRVTLDVRFSRAGPLTDVADTLCRLDPARRIPEMSGPVSAGRAGPPRSTSAASAAVDR